VPAGFRRDGNDGGAVCARRILHLADFDLSRDRNIVRERLADAFDRDGIGSTLDFGVLRLAPVVQKLPGFDECVLRSGHCKVIFVFERNRSHTAAGRVPRHVADVLLGRKAQSPHIVRNGRSAGVVDIIGDLGCMRRVFQIRRAVTGALGVARQVDLCETRLRPDLVDQCIDLAAPARWLGRGRDNLALCAGLLPERMVVHRDESVLTVAVASEERCHVRDVVC
jgi:hypothetical protein